MPPEKHTPSATFFAAAFALLLGLALNAWEYFVWFGVALGSSGVATGPFEKMGVFLLWTVPPGLVYGLFLSYGFKFSSKTMLLFVVLGNLVLFLFLITTIFG